MPNWFIGKIKYQQPIDDSTVGTRNEFTKVQTITEAYLVDAVSYTEAEARLYQEIAANTPDFEITGINRMHLADVYFNEEDGGETWYKVKAMYILEDEKTGKQKKTPSTMLILAQNPKQAYERIEYALKTSLDPFEITDVNTTKILDVFPYTGEEPRPAADENEQIDESDTDNE
jgi:hypothetical protein